MERIPESSSISFAERQLKTFTPEEKIKFAGKLIERLTEETDRRNKGQNTQNRRRKRIEDIESRETRTETVIFGETNSSKKELSELINAMQHTLSPGQKQLIEDLFGLQGKQQRAVEDISSERHISPKKY